VHQATYKQLLPEWGGHLTDGVAIDPDRLRGLLTTLAASEEETFAHRQVGMLSFS
jgi:hypothetical protein